MAAERVLSGLHELIKEEVLAAVREELAAHKEEVDKLRHMLTAVKKDLAEQKGTMAEQWAESTRESDAGGLKWKSRKRRHEMVAEFPREEERRKEVQEFNMPHAMEELAAGEEWQKVQDMKVNVKRRIKRSVGDKRTAWRAINAALQKSDLSLACLRGLSDAMLINVSTMTHLTSIDLDSSSGFSAEGIKHLYRLPHLEKLNFNYSDFLDSALEGIGSLSRLIDLSLHQTNVTDAGLSHLTALTSLKDLRLGYCSGVTDAGMVHLVRLTGLEKLAPDGTAVTDDGLQQLTALTKLTDLYTPWQLNFPHQYDSHVLRLPLLVGSAAVAGAARVAGVAEVAVVGVVGEAAGVVEVVGVVVGVEAVGGVAAGPGAVEAAAAVVGEEAAAVAVEVGAEVDLAKRVAPVVAAAAAAAATAAAAASAPHLPAAQ
ncbi:unnamed protein product [Closterium sp. Yama58-4]|nr:unnamed protein product [Closterium sp. Yama58-4]